MGKRIPTEPGTFRVWRPGLDHEADGAEVIAWDAKTAAVQYATRQPWSTATTHLMLFGVRDLETGKRYKVEVMRELEPEFHAPEDAKEWT